MALGRDGIAGVTRTLERLLALLWQQRAAALGWRAEDAAACAAQAEALQRSAGEELARADDGELGELLPMVREVQALGRANWSILGQALGLIRQWRRILSGTEAVSYDRDGRPVELPRTFAGGRVA